MHGHQPGRNEQKKTNPSTRHKRLPGPARGLHNNSDSGVRNEIWIAREVLLVSVSRFKKLIKLHNLWKRLSRAGWTDTPAIVVAATVAFGFAALPRRTAAAAGELGREIDLSHLDDLLTSDISNRSIYFANIFRPWMDVALPLSLINA